MPAVLNNAVIDENASKASPMIPQRPTFRLRLFYLSQRVSVRVHRLIEALQGGFWLGLLDRDQINALVSHRYDEAEMYRTTAHNFFGFFASEKEIMKDHFNGCRSALVAAAGGGREMIALAQAGVRVDGFECNPGLVEKCKEFLAQAGVSASIVCAAPDEVPPGLQQYDGAIIGFGALAHIVGRKNRVTFLRSIKNHLYPRAPLLLSAARRPQGSKYHVWVYQIARAIRTLRGSAEPVELGDNLFDCFMHQFVENELKSELEEAGFNVLAFMETHDLYAIAQA